MEQARKPADGEATGISSVMPGERRLAPAVIVVARDVCIRHATALYLRVAAGYSVLATGTLPEAGERCGDFAPALLLLHVEPGCEPTPAAMQAWRARCGAPVILLATAPGPRELASLRPLGARDVVAIPADPERLLDRIEEVLAEARP